MTPRAVRLWRLHRARVEKRFLLAKLRDQLRREQNRTEQDRLAREIRYCTWRLIELDEEYRTLDAHGA